MLSRWTTADIPNQAGRRAVITGANSGIGFPAALELARHGATVVLACRDLDKGNDAARRILAELPSAHVEVSELNLASLQSIEAFAARELAGGHPLDLLLNNAGIYQPPRRRETEDGFELQFGTNVLGHFALTARLLPSLERAAAATTASPAGPPRVVWVASIAHKTGKIHFTDIQYRGNYSPRKTYAQSKLADLMLAFELDRRLRARRSPILSVAAHPGIANTNLFKTASNPIEVAMRRWTGHIISLLLNSDTEGALPTLYAATSPDAKGGGYYGPQGFAEARGGDVGPARIADRARDTKAASKLWDICEDLTHTHMP